MWVTAVMAPEDQDKKIFKGVILDNHLAKIIGFTRSGRAVLTTARIQKNIQRIGPHSETTHQGDRKRGRVIDKTHAALIIGRISYALPRRKLTLAK